MRNKRSDIGKKRNKYKRNSYGFTKEDIKDEQSKNNIVKGSALLGAGLGFLTSKYKLEGNLGQKLKEANEGFKRTTEVIKKAPNKDILNDATKSAKQYAKAAHSFRVAIGLKRGLALGTGALIPLLAGNIYLANQRAKKARQYREKQGLTPKIIVPKNYKYRLADNI